MAAVVRALRSAARPDQLPAMARFGLAGKGRLGVPVPLLRRMGKAIGRNHSLARALQETGIPDAQILASLIAEPERMSPAEMTRWVSRAEAWDVCDQTCLNTFVLSPHAWLMVERWSGARGEFVRRAAFALLACLAVHDRTAPGERFLRVLPLVAGAAGDERNAVKKGVSWALRAMGKRSDTLRRAVMKRARLLSADDASRSARWIARDVLRELESYGRGKARR